MERPVESPERIWSTVDQSALWLGLTAKQFTREYRDYPNLLPHQEFGTTFMWHWSVLVAYQFLRPYLSQVPRGPDDPVRKSRKKPPAEDGA